MYGTFVTLWLQVVQPLANVHETKWTPHVKRQSDVAQSCNISAIIIITRCSMRETREMALKETRVCVCVCVFAKFYQFLPVRSHFDTKRPVNFFHIATFQSATFGRSLFAFVLCVLRQKIIKKPKMIGNRIDRRNRLSAQREEMNATLYCRLITRWRHGFLL